MEAGLNLLYKIRITYTFLSLLSQKPSCFRKAFYSTKLSGKHDAKIVIRVLRFPVVHVRTVRIGVTNVDEVAVRRLLSLLFSLYFTEKRQKCSFSVYFSVVALKHLHQKKVSSFANSFTRYSFDCACQSKI